MDNIAIYVNTLIKLIKQIIEKSLSNINTGKNMTPKEIANNRTDLLTFTRTMFKVRNNSEMKHNFHIDLICQALEKVATGETKKLIINVPEQSGKTGLAVKAFIAWCMGNFPDSEFIHASYSKSIAKHNVYSVVSIMQYEKYHKIFPEVTLSRECKDDDAFITSQGGGVYTKGFAEIFTETDTVKIGNNFKGAIILDDPRRELHSRTIIDELQNTKKPIILIMSRRHMYDLSGILLIEDIEKKWDKLIIPAFDDDGVYFWPDKFRAKSPTKYNMWE